jgi:uncharacterized RDD family membrane protein YckC
VEKKSTLIEFPGVSRNSLPEWRKELSEKVREVQERRAREAAREAAEAERRKLDDASNPPQLELLPPAPMPAINPLVAAALKRIERAHQTAPPENGQRGTLATAIAYAPEREENDIGNSVRSNGQLALESEVVIAASTVIVEKQPHLAVVSGKETIDEIKTAATPKRLFIENDPALNYLDSISRSVRVDVMASTCAPAFRRLVGALVDLLCCGLLSSPIVLAIYFTGSNLQETRVIAVLGGSVVVVTFLYLTLMTALTGRTGAMRMLSLRVIDTRTGLIPTGRQSIGRSFFYLISLATGIALLFPLLSREGYALHDRFTGTAVVTN